MWTINTHQPCSNSIAVLFHLDIIIVNHSHECVFECRKLYHPDQEEKTADTTQEEAKE